MKRLYFRLRDARDDSHTVWQMYEPRFEWGIAFNVGNGLTLEWKWEDS